MNLNSYFLRIKDILSIKYIYIYIYIYFFVYCSIPCDTDLPLRQIHQDEKLGKGMV